MSPIARGSQSAISGMMESVSYLSDSASVRPVEKAWWRAWPAICSASIDESRMRQFSASWFAKKASWDVRAPDRVLLIMPSVLEITIQRRTRNVWPVVAQQYASATLFPVRSEGRLELDAEPESPAPGIYERELGEALLRGSIAEALA